MAMAAGVPVRRDGRRAPPGERPGLAVGSERRLLEADSKSLCSVNGARRASASSPGPSSLALSQLGPLEEETWSLWGRIVSNWDEWRKKKEKLLKELIRKGIPQQFRAAGWQRLCGVAELPLKARYPELLWVSLPCERLIRRDFARTYPEHTLFSGQRSLGQQVLFNVRKVTWGQGDMGTLGTSGALGSS
nr:EVI5-like protein [Taeniopygia guttata]